MGYGLPLSEGEFNDLIRTIDNNIRRIEEGPCTDWCPRPMRASC